MDIATWINPIYALIGIIAMFLLVPFERIKELWPVGLIAAALLFVSQFTALSLELVRYNAGLIMVVGTPFFQYIWAFAYGIIIINYMPREWTKRLPLILLFALINQVMTFIAWSIGNLSFLNGYNMFYDYVLTVAVFSIGVWLADRFFEDRVYGAKHTI